MHDNRVESIIEVRRPEAGSRLDKIITSWNETWTQINSVTETETLYQDEAAEIREILETVDYTASVDFVSGLQARLAALELLWNRARVANRALREQVQSLRLDIDGADQGIGEAERHVRRLKERGAHASEIRAAEADLSKTAAWYLSEELVND